jgi:hypothetical protein
MKNENGAPLTNLSSLLRRLSSVSAPQSSEPVGAIAPLWFIASSICEFGIPGPASVRRRTDRQVCYFTLCCKPPHRPSLPDHFTLQGFRQRVEAGR